MGFHLITHPLNKEMKSRYFHDLDKLIRAGDFPDDSIIYEGEEAWKPFHLSDHPCCEQYVDTSKRVGRRGELKFAAMAKKKGYVLQEIDQSQESFRCYYENWGRDVKRCDYIIMNLAGIQVDVKCYTVYGKDNLKYFLLGKEDVENQYNLGQETHHTIVFAIYEREENWPKAESLKMIDIDSVRQCPIREISKRKAYFIDIREMQEGFSLLDRIKEKPTNINSLLGKYDEPQSVKIEGKEKSAEFKGKEAKPKRKIFQKYFPWIKKSYVWKLLSDISLMALIIAMFYFVMSHISGKSFITYKPFVALAFGVIILLHALRIGKNNLYAPILIIIAGGFLAHQPHHYLGMFSLPISYYIAFMLIGVIVFARHLFNRL